MSFLAKLAETDPKELIKLLLLLGAVAAGCQVNRAEIREQAVEAEAEFVEMDSNYALLQDSISILNRRVARLESKSPQRPTRKVYRKPEQPKGLVTRIWNFFGG